MSDYDKEIEEAAKKYGESLRFEEKHITMSGVTFLVDKSYHDAAKIYLQAAFKFGAKFQQQKDAERIKILEEKNESLAKLCAKLICLDPRLEKIAFETLKEASEG